MWVILIVALAVAFIDLSGISLDSRLDNLLYVNEESYSNVPESEFFDQKDETVYRAINSPEEGTFSDLSPKETTIGEEELMSAIQRIYKGDKE